MILSGRRIAELVANGEIGIEPFDEKNLRDASYVFTLGSRLSVHTGAALVAGSMPKLEERVTSEDGYFLKPGEFVIGYTREHLRLGGNYSCIISTRGEAAHNGLNVTQASLYAEPNTDWPLVLEISNQSGLPVKLVPGVGIAKGIFVPIQPA